MAIKLLTSDIVNQIAAGEVIENPSAVVKELIENSIDARATQIDIDLENGGFKKISISDNGKGILKEDLLLAPIRHATSKIENFNDLYNIKTMGFRGEALASIFSVSKAKIMSKHNEYEIGYEINSEDIETLKECGVSNGTCVVVEDLFYNTPARKKYMKSENLEYKAVLDIVNRYEIYHNNIKFTLRNNQKIVINKPAFESVEDNIYYVAGRDLKGNLLYVEKEIKGLKIKGFIGKPSEVTYSFRKNQYLYVNSRYVKSNLIREAIYEGFGTNLMVGRHPPFFLFIDIDPEIIDVNVHPTKIEIRFENELEIFEFVKNAIKDVFMKNETFKSFEKKESDTKLSEKVDDFIFEEKNKERFVERVKSDINEKDSKYFSKEYQKYFDQSEFEVANKTELEKSSFMEDSIDLSIEKNNVEESFNNEEESVSYGPLFETLREYRIVGQINKTFIILETPTDMIVVDQHVAEEKFYFEMFKEQIENKKARSQTLLKSEIVELSKQEMIVFKENKDLLENLGFGCEEFGENEVIVREVPYDINKNTVNPFVIKDMLNEIRVDNKFRNLEEEKIERLASMSCKKSIKAGDELTTPQIHKMIENLKRLKEPFNCPHGRPILLKWSFGELEKKFKRIV